MSDLHIPTPCHEAWDGMTPATNGRHCATCNHTVIDIANMPVAEGRRTLRDITSTLTHGGQRTCVRAHATPAGRLVPGRRKLLTSALAGILACTIAGCDGDGPDLAGQQPQTPQTPTTQQPVTGITAPPPLTGTPRVHPPQTVEVTMGDICVAPTKGKIVAIPDQPPVVEPPKPEHKPDDGITVGTVHADDGDRAP